MAVCACNTVLTMDTFRGAWMKKQFQCVIFPDWSQHEVCISVLTLLVGWRKMRPACTTFKLLQFLPKILFGEAVPTCSNCREKASVWVCDIKRWDKCIQLLLYTFKLKIKKENERFFAQVSGIKLTRKVYFHIYISKPHHHHNRFTILFSGPPWWAGARKELLDLTTQGKIKKGRYTDHPARRHSIQTNQCPSPPSPHIFFTGRMPFLPPNQQHQSTEGIYISKHGRKFFTSTLCFFHNLNELEETSLMQPIKWKQSHIPKQSRSHQTHGLSSATFNVQWLRCNTQTLWQSN